MLKKISDKFDFSQFTLSLCIETNFQNLNCCSCNLLPILKCLHFKGIKLSKYHATISHVEGGATGVIPPPSQVSVRFWVSFWAFACSCRCFGGPQENHLKLGPPPPLCKNNFRRLYNLINDIKHESMMSSDFPLTQRKKYLST